MRTRASAARTAAVTFAALVSVLLAVVGVAGRASSAPQDCTVLQPCPTNLPTTAPPTSPSTTGAPSTTATQPASTAVPVSTTASTDREQTTTPPATTPTGSSQGGPGNGATTTTSNPLIILADPSAPVPVAIPGQTRTIGTVKPEDKTGAIVALVIAVLVVVALVLGLLTFRFWRNTRPLAVRPAVPATPVDADLDPTRPLVRR